MTAVYLILGSSLLWLAIACPFAVFTGRVSKVADAAEPDLLADQPVDVLSPAEVDRRFAAMTATERVWWA